MKLKLNHKQINQKESFGTETLIAVGATANIYKILKPKPKEY